MIVGLLFIAMCLCGFLSYKQVVHNSCNMGTGGLPKIYTLSPRACGTVLYDIYIYIYILVSWCVGGYEGFAMV